jgi:hypothetical protein
MNDLMVDKIFNTENIFYNKLKFWYGKYLDNKQVSVLHTKEVEGNLCTVVFIIKEDKAIEIARIFTIGDHVGISIDLQCNVTCIGAIKQLIQYGSNNYKAYEIED